jgi:O-antigen ligase
MAGGGASAPEQTARPRRSGLAEGFGLALAAAFLLASLAVRFDWLFAVERRGVAVAACVAVLLGLSLCLARRSWLAPSLSGFAASFLLYGFHSYRPPSQVFELLLTAFSLVLLLRLLGARGAAGRAGAGGALPLLALYALIATSSLLLLPRPVLEARAFVEGSGLGRAVLSAFPKDPLYPIASVGRLWLFALFAALLAAQADGRALCRALARGVAWAAIAAAVLGLLDFAGLVSLDRYNLSNLFYGSRYRRLQSTFGNPSWFACFVACALPFVLLEFREARGRVRVLLAAAFPLVAASLVLSGARASWLAATLMVALLLVALFVAPRPGRSLPRPDGPAWLALGSTFAVAAVLAAMALATPTTIAPGEVDVAPGRLEGLARELQYRGLGLQSPRRVAAAYALELARLAPVQGLGHDSFNLHLRAQLEIPGSGVARAVNAAAAQDAGETVFDDSHNTYLQVLTGTGAVGLVLWLAAALAGLRLALRGLRSEASPEALAVVLGLAVFHFYGLFQGMAYIPVTFVLLPLLTAYATTLDPALEPATGRRSRIWPAAALLVLLAAAAGYASDTGYASLKRRLGVQAYLPDEAAEFEGFYRPETGTAGEFRWMRRRAIVNLRRAAPFRISFACEHPDAEREPVVLWLWFGGRDAGQIVFRRPGAVERRFDFGAPGALRLSVSRGFRPGGSDRRELGVAVSALRWE